MRQKRLGVEIDGVAARRLHNRHAVLGNVVAKVSRRGDPVAQVVFLQRLLHAHRDRLQIAAGESAVGGIALGQNQQILLLARQNVVVGAQKAADVGHAVFLGAHGAAVAQREHLLRNLLGRLVRRSPARAA